MSPRAGAGAAVSEEEAGGAGVAEEEEGAVEQGA